CFRVPAQSVWDEFNEEVAAGRRKADFVRHSKGRLRIAHRQIREWCRMAQLFSGCPNSLSSMPFTASALAAQPESQCHPTVQNKPGGGPPPIGRRRKKTARSSYLRSPGPSL